MFFRLGFVVVLSLFSSVSLAEQVYRWVDENGVTQFSDYPRDRHSQAIEIREKNSAFLLMRACVVVLTRLRIGIVFVLSVVRSLVRRPVNAP